MSQQLVRQGAGGPGEGAVTALGQGDGAAEGGRGERDADERSVGRQGDGRHDCGAEPGRHKGEHTGHLRSLADEMRFDARLLAGRQRHGAQVIALAEHDQVQAVEIAHPHLAAAGERVVGRRGQDERVVEERRGHHQRVGHRQDHQGQVDLTGGHLWHQLVRAGLHHRQVDARVAGVEGDQGRGQRAGDQAGGGPDGQPAAGHP